MNTTANPIAAFTENSFAGGYWPFPVDLPPHPGNAGLENGLIDAASQLESVMPEPGKGAGLPSRWKVVYGWTVFEKNVHNVHIDYRFSVYTLNNRVLNGEAELLYVKFFDGNGEIGENLLKRYRVTVWMNSADYAGAGTLNGIAAFTGSQPAGVFMHYCSLDYPDHFFTGNPARAEILTRNGQVFIVTEKDLPHLHNPVCGVFHYRKWGKRCWQRFRFSGLGDTFFLSPGRYEYRCGLIYRFGISKEKTGVFTV